MEMSLATPWGDFVLSADGWTLLAAWFFTITLIATARTGKLP